MRTWLIGASISLGGERQLRDALHALFQNPIMLWTSPMPIWIFPTSMMMMELMRGVVKKRGARRS